MARGQRRSTDAEWGEWGEPEAAVLDPSRIAEVILEARVARRRVPKAVDIGDALAAVLDRSAALAPWAARIAVGAEVDVSSPNMSPVRIWRWHHLGGAEGRPVQLLAERDVDGWILNAWRAAPVPGRLGPDGEVAPFERLSDLRGVGGVPLEWRRRRGRRWEVQAWSAAPEHAALGGLARLAGDLGRRFSWEVSEAVAFVLCGTVPTVHPIRGHVELRAATPAAERAGVRPRGLEGRTVDAFARVVVELDPTLTPDELAAWWREVRRELEPADGWPVAGPVRNELARWLATAGGSWAELHRAWNESHPGHEVGDRTNLARLGRTAVRRLLSLGIG